MDMFNELQLTLAMDNSGKLDKSLSAIGMDVMMLPNPKSNWKRTGMRAERTESRCRLPWKKIIALI